MGAVWQFYEYLCFIVCGVIAAMFDMGENIKRRWIDKSKTAAELRDEAIEAAPREEIRKRNQVAIVTGGNTGIGLETCYWLLIAGYRVVIGCRSAQAGKEAIEYLKTEIAKSPKKFATSELPVEVIPLDLSSQKSITDFASAIRTKALNVSLLINNAGVMFVTNRPTVEGFEIHFGVNHLGHFKLTLELFDILYYNGPSRVLNITSDTHMFGKTNFLDNGTPTGKNYHRWFAYCNSKLANILSARVLNRKCEEAGLADRIKIFSVHPGVVKTTITREVLPIIDYLYSTRIVRSILGLVDPRDGASGSVYVALSKDVENCGGHYFVTAYDSEKHLAKSAQYNKELEERLFAFSQEHTNMKFGQVVKKILKGQN